MRKIVFVTLSALFFINSSFALDLEGIHIMPNGRVMTGSGEWLDDATAMPDGKSFLRNRMIFCCQLLLYLPAFANRATRVMNHG